MTAQQDDPERPLGALDAHYHILVGGQEIVVLRHTHMWRPPTDVMEGEDWLLIVVEIAGMQQNDFHVAVGNRHVTISGTRAGTRRTGAAYHQLEIRYGEFRTDVALPWPVDEENITARYEDGFLYVELPRARTRKIQVSGTGSTAAS